ncbi:MAG TPA: hypothetical protein VGC42_19975 [Kofleriaceae bacterium]
MITTPSTAVLATLDADFLASVSGGCHKQCAPQPIINNNNITVPPAASAVPQAPAAAPPCPPPQMDAGPQVSTSVSINGQPAA